MTVVARRTFIIGLASVITAPLIATPSKFLGEIATGTLRSALKWRRLCDFTMSSMPTGQEIRALDFVEDPVRWTLLRDDDPFYVVTMNPRATIRWVAVPGSEIEISERSVLRVVVEPCHTFTTINICSDIEKDRDPAVRRRMFAETFRWRDGKPELDSIAALDPRDARVLEQRA